MNKKELTVSVNSVEEFKFAHNHLVTYKRPLEVLKLQQEEYSLDVIKSMSLCSQKNHNLSSNSCSS